MVQKTKKNFHFKKKHDYFNWFEDGKLNLTYNCVQKEILIMGWAKKLLLFSR